MSPPNVRSVLDLEAGVAGFRVPVPGLRTPAPDLRLAEPFFPEEPVCRKPSI